MSCRLRLVGVSVVNSCFCTATIITANANWIVCRNADEGHILYGKKATGLMICGCSVGNDEVCLSMLLRAFAPLWRLSMLKWVMIG